MILRTARGIMAALQPMTGARATGSIVVTTDGTASVAIPRNSYALPVVDGQQRPDLAVKTAEGPNDDGSWTATPAGVAVEVFSNLGGRRHNVASGTKFAFDPAISGVKSATASALFTGGADSAEYGALADLALHEHATGDKSLDLARSMLKAFPGALLTWVSDEPVDGSNADMTSRRGRLGTRVALYKLTYQLAVFAERASSDHARRAEGLEVLDGMTELLADRQAIDGQPISNPSGLQILRRWRETGGGPVYQRFYVYGILVCAMTVLSRTDARSWNSWYTTIVDVDKPDDAGDVHMVTDMAMEMPQDD